MIFLEKILIRLIVAVVRRSEYLEIASGAQFFGTTGFGIGFYPAMFVYRSKVL